MISAQVDINRLFIELFQWRACKVSECDVESFERFVHICFRITCALMDDQRVAREIGKVLGILIKIEKERNPSEDLITSFAALEEDLEESLRGFSSLLNWVLEENKIRHDPAFLLDSISWIDENIYAIFHQLFASLCVYYDLDDVFHLKAPMTLSLLFLHALGSLYDEMKAAQGENGASAIVCWLQVRVRNKRLSSLYELILKGHDSTGVINQNVALAKELLLYGICLKAARGLPVAKDEIPIIDMALSKFGMLGLLPLLNAGFLSLEDDHKTVENIRGCFKLPNF